jgi:S1-C subfamily serine protease
VTGPRRTALGQFSLDIIEITARCRPAVTTIRGETSTGMSTGSGFLIDGAGNVVTNHHVVDDSNGDLQIQFATGLVGTAALVGADPLTDLAVVRAESPLPAPLQVRTHPPVLGEICLAMGSPLGDYTESVSIGIVSGLARTIPTKRGRPLERAIQTDAAINPGNSGGPLIDAAGLVLGVNTCVDSRAVSIGFAVPGETVDWVVRQILQYGDVRRGALGVAVASRIENVDGQLRHAPVITRVSADLTCDLRPGDIIIGLAGRPVRDRADLYYLLTRDMIGTLIPVELWRQDCRVRCDVPVREYVPPAVVNPD